MHNSFGIRELLRTMNAHDLVRNRRNPHRTVGRNDESKPKTGDMHLTGEWTVECCTEPNTDVVLRKDLEDFLRRMGVSVEATADRVVRFQLGPDDAQGCLASPDQSGTLGCQLFGTGFLAGIS